tara:strand:- start:72 stop:386 length:315 start_codon:yes stop_codon:yes gene_type:complete
MTFTFPWRTRKVKHPVAIKLFYEDPQARETMGVILGMTDGGVTYLTDLLVVEKYRGKGIGTLLVEQFIEAAKDTTIVLLTADANDFYKKFGFEERAALVRKPKQ